MTRPAIDPANIRHQSTPAKILRTICRFLFWTAVTALTAVVFVHIFDPALNPLIP